MMASPHLNGNPDIAVLLCFLSGCIIFVLGVLNLGVLMRFISVPVTTGFTMAAALTVGSGQINNLFGIQSNTNEFLKSWINFFSHIKETRRNDAILGWCTLIFLLFMRVSWKILAFSYILLIFLPFYCRNLRILNAVHVCWPDIFRWVVMSSPSSLGSCCAIC